MLDISITTLRKRGEHRKSGVKNKASKDSLWLSPKKKNVYSELMNHRKHEGLIYRNANGNEEVRGKPRFHSDYFM